MLRLSIMMLEVQISPWNENRQHVCEGKVSTLDKPNWLQTACILHDPASYVTLVFSINQSGDQAVSDRNTLPGLFPAPGKLHRPRSALHNKHSRDYTRDTPLCTVGDVLDSAIPTLQANLSMT